MDKLYDTVTDTEGRPISGATVSVMNEDTGSAQTLYTILGASLGTTTTTNDAGYYEAFVPDGSYVITVTYPVLNPITRTRVKVTGDRTFANLAALRLAKTATLLDGDSVYVLSHTSGAVGGGTFYWSASSADADDNGITILPTGHVGNGRWKRANSGTVSVTDFGASPSATASVNIAAIMAAINAIGPSGGGTIHFQHGNYSLTNPNAPAASWDNDVAIWALYDNIHLVGDELGTKLSLANGANCHVIKFGQRASGTVTVDNCSVRLIEIDGNRANQTTPTDANYHWQGIDVSSNCTNINLSELYIHDIVYYGIGMQRDGISNSRISNVLIENTGADGIDWKNDTGAGTGNFVDNVTVRNFGLVSALTLPQAGVDLRSGVIATNIFVSEMTGATDLVGVRTLGDGDGTGLLSPSQPTKLSNITVIGNDDAASIGVRITTRNSMASNIHASNCGDGVKVSTPDCRLSNIDVQSNVNGINILPDATAALEGDTISINGALVRGNTGSGIIYDSVDEITVVGADVRTNAIGHEIKSGSSNVRIIGGSLNGNTSAAVSDSGTGTIIKDVSGFKTRSVVVSGTTAIDSTGTKSIVIAHGLAVTPDINDVVLTIKRNTNVTDWTCSHLWTVATDGTNISAQMEVSVASATGGATVYVVATIASKHGN